MGEHADVDKWIETLRQCKPLSEANVKGLCDKVYLFPIPKHNDSSLHSHCATLIPSPSTVRRPEKFYKTSRMSSLCAAPLLCAVMSTANSMT
jgi:hypothetical protein